MTDITIVMTTWLPPGKELERAKAINDAMESWEKNLINDGKIHLHIADDGSNQNTLGILVLAPASYWKLGYVSVSTQPRRGVGASLNAGLKRAFENSPIVLHAVDDWELLSPLDLNPWVNFLEDRNYDTGMVRFFPHPDLTGTIKHIPPHGWAVELQRHHFVFGFRPCLWHKRFFDSLGYFEEGVSALDAEDLFNQKLVGKYPEFEGEHVWLALPEVWRPIESVELSAIVPS